MTHDATSQTARILKLLKSRGRATNAELSGICFRYSARIHELRQEGHDIFPQRIKGSLWEFVYRGHRDEEPTS